MIGNNGVDSAHGNGVLHVDPADDAAEKVLVFSDKEEKQVDPSDGESINAEDSVQIAPDDTRITEDVEKEDMFLDAADEIENSEPQIALEGKDNQHDAEVKELSNGIQGNDLMAEIEHLRHMLEHTTAERDNYARKYEEEGKALRELNDKIYLKDQETEKYQNVEESACRILASLGASAYQEGIVDESMTGKMYHVENAMHFLLEKYNLFLSGINQLKMSLVEVDPDNAMQEEGAIFSTACNNILGLKGKVVDLEQKLVGVEHENKQLMEQLEEHSAWFESANADTNKLKAELEQERTRYASTKEKLSLAVTKGKALVQLRDLLKKSLAENEGELEKCLTQLSEKCGALEIAERNTDLLVKSETLVASLQESLTEKDAILSKCGEILLNIVETDEYQLMDIIEKVRYLSEERSEANRVSLEFRKLVNALSSFDFPETVKLNGLDAKIVWLLESIDAAQVEVSKLQDEILSMKEAAHDEIGRLSSLLTTETQDRHYLQVELEDLRVKCDKIAASEHQALVEKDRIIFMLQEASGVTLNDQEEQNQDFSNVAMIVDACVAKIKDDISGSFNFSNNMAKNFEKMQDLLYISNMNLELYAQILEEVMFGRSEMSSLAHELVVLRNELNIVNGAKDSLQADVERSEEKAALLREKLSMAVKKGKGIFQERENLRKALDEKNTDIENLTVELQGQKTDCNSLRDQINRFTVDLERIPQLESDILSIQEQKNQVEKFLAESNSILQKVLESIDGVGIPVDITFDEPVEKVNWLAGYLIENQRAKILADQDLELSHKEVRELTDEIKEMELTITSLKDALSAAERNIAQLIDEKEAAISSRAAAVIELDRVKEEKNSKEARDLAEMEEFHLTVTSLKDALSVAESKISGLTEEKDVLSVSKTYVEEELKKAIEESSFLTNKNAEVCARQKSLEDALQVAERNITQLMDEKEAAISSRAAAEIELDKVKKEKASKEARDLVDETEDAQITVKSLKEALSSAESKISELEEEKEGLTVSKTYIEQELKKAMEESSSLTDKFAEVCSNKESLEDALQAAERNITQVTDEKEAAISSNTATAIELEKMKEEITVQTSKLSEADRLKQTLEDSLSQAQENLILLTEENKNAKSNTTDLENELRKLKDEVDSHVLRFSDANSTIKSLQDSLSSAEDKIFGLINEKKNTEEEISSLNLKLNSCLQELDGTHGSLESCSMELSGHLSSLTRLLKDETLSSFLLQSFKKKIGFLNDMNLLLQEVRESIIEVDSEILQSFSFAEDETSPTSVLPSGLEYVLDVETSNGEENSTDVDNIVFYVGKTVERLQLRDKILAEKVEHFSAFTDNMILSIFKKLHMLKTMLTSMPELIKSLKQKLDELESDRQAMKDNIFMLESYNGSLLPACTDATKQLKLEFEQCLSELKSNSHLSRLNDICSINLGTFDVSSVGENQLYLGSNDYEKAAEDILFAARQSRDLNRHFQNVLNKMMTTTDYLQNELQESKITSEKLLEERNLSENEVMKLKNDLEKSEIACQKMRVSLEEHKQRENNLIEREPDISSKFAGSLKKLQEVEDYSLSASQTKSIFDKINRIDVSPSELDTGNLELYGSPDVEKLFYIVDSYAGLEDQISLLSAEKQKLHATIDYQVSEIKHLKEEFEEHHNYINENEKMKNELSDLAIGLENIIQKLGGDEAVDCKKEVSGVTGLLKLIETRVVASKLESRNLKAKAEELNYKLLEMQKVVDNLSSKNRSSEDSSHGRGVFESSSSPMMSEISEIQDMGSLGKNKAIPPAIPPVQSAPHPRPLRKGSGDHLAINVDSDSEPFIKEENNENKGHAFMSLNTSGLIPRQGKMIADRVDGMWVNGSRALMNHPRARLGLVTYWLLIHLWLLGSIL